MEIHDFRRLIVDANIMVSALLGESFPLLLNMVEKGVTLFAPEPQIAETAKILAKITKHDEDWIGDQMERLDTIITPLHPTIFEIHEEKARSRLHKRGQSDWPVLAASYETRAGVWSHDKDFFGTGAPIWSTRVLRKQMEMVDESV